MKLSFLAAALVVFSTFPASADVPIQEIRNAIGRHCMTAFRTADLLWYLDRQRDGGLDALCSCAVERSLEKGVSSRHIAPSLFSSPRALTKEGRSIVQMESHLCGIIHYGGHAPDLKPKAKKSSIATKNW